MNSALTKLRSRATPVDDDAEDIAVVVDKRDKGSVDELATLVAGFEVETGR